MHIMEDMPKLDAPFVREQDGDRSVVVNKINPGYEWVFESPHVRCVEKLDGTNVSIGVADGRLLAVRNRTNVIRCDTWEMNRFISGIRVAYQKGRVPFIDGQHFGELMGEGIQGNFLDLEGTEWFPFAYLRKKFHYKSFDKYPREFEGWSMWFRDDIFSLVHKAINPQSQVVQPEGVVFYEITTGRMAKLRRDMFDWYKEK